MDKKGERVKQSKTTNLPIPPRVTAYPAGQERVITKGSRNHGGEEQGTRFIAGQGCDDTPRIGTPRLSDFLSACQQSASVYAHATDRRGEVHCGYLVQEH